MKFFGTSTFQASLLMIITFVGGGCADVSPQERNAAISYKYALPDAEDFLPGNYFTCLAVCEPKSLIAVGSYDGKILILDSKFRIKKIVSIAKHANDVSFSGDGSLLAASGWENEGRSSIAIIDVQSGYVQRLLPGGPNAGQLAFSHAGYHLAVRSDKEVQIWQCQSGQMEKLIPRLECPDTGISFSSDDTRLYCGGCIIDLLNSHAEPNRRIKFDISGWGVMSADCKEWYVFESSLIHYFTFGRQRSEAEIGDYRTGKVTGKWKLNYPECLQEVRSLNVSEDNQRLLVCGQSLIFVHNSVTGKVENILRYPRHGPDLDADNFPSQSIFQGATFLQNERVVIAITNYAVLKYILN